MNHRLHYLDIPAQAALDAVRDEPSTLSILLGAALAVLGLWVTTFILFSL